MGKVIGGYYADLETSCQMFHVCTIGQHNEPMDIRFLCLNGTVFDQVRSFFRLVSSLVVVFKLPQLVVLMLIIARKPASYFNLLLNSIVLNYIIEFYFLNRRLHALFSKCILL